MKKTVCCLAVLGLLALGGPAVAEICTVDDVPAATLLLPYFEVDLDNVGGLTTLFSVNNASAADTIAHVVVWTDLSVPVLDFNIYLTGFDVQTVNMRDILFGALPQTDAVAPFNGLSNQGDFSVLDGTLNRASCANQLPYAALQPANFVAHLQSTLTGGPSTLAAWGGNCAAIDHGDNIARGYVTIDDANLCSLDFPGDPGYFVAGGLGSASNDNQLWGDYFYVDPSNDFAQGETLVHIEADALDPETAVAGEYTFYGRYVAWNAADNREPLVGTFASRFVTQGAFTGGTDLLVWRDSKLQTSAIGWDCASIPNVNPVWHPLGQEDIVIFDEEENPQVPEGCQVSPCDELEQLIPFPIEAQRTHVGGPALPVPFTFGWLYLNLNFNTGNGNPPEDPTAMQNWVTTVMSAEGRYSVGFDAIALDSSCNANHVNPGPIAQ
jgi:hypothetical protein